MEPLNRRAILTLLIGRAAIIISPSAGVAEESNQVALYKDPQCNCCEEYDADLRGNRFEVNIVPTHDLALLDEKCGIPTDLQPCHISPGMVGMKTELFELYEIAKDSHKIYAPV